MEVYPNSLSLISFRTASPDKKHNQEKNCKNKQQKLALTFAHSTYYNKHHQKNRPFDGVF